MKKSVSDVFDSGLPVKLDVEEVESIPTLGPRYELKELSVDRTLNSPTPTLSIDSVDLLDDDPEEVSDEDE